MGRLLIILGLALPLSARAQFELPGMGGDKGNEPAVRLAEDPRQELIRVRRGLMERQQGLLLEARDADTWTQRQLAVRARKAQLSQQRKKIVLSEAPSAAARIWESDELAPEVLEEPDAAPPPADLGVDGGVGDGGLDAGVPAPDGGRPDGQPSDAGASDADVGDAAPIADATHAQVVPPKLVPRVFELPVLTFKDDSFLAPGVHPAEAEELEQAIKALDQLDETLTLLQHLHSEERALTSAAVTSADALLKLMDDARRAKTEEAKGADKKDEKKKEPNGLGRTENLAFKVFTAEIRVSLASAEEPESTGADELAPDDTELKEIRPLESKGVDPTAAFADSYGRASILRAETEALIRERGGLANTSVVHQEKTQRAREVRHRLELKTHERELATAERDYHAALENMVITRSEINELNESLEASQGRRQKAIPQIEEQINGLRRAATQVAADTGPLGAAKVAEIESTLLSEQITRQRMMLHRDTFERDLGVALQAILEGEEPGVDFREKYKVLLDPDALAKRKRDRDTRCEGWRRQSTDVKATKAAGEAATRNRARILRAYEGLSDVCNSQSKIHGTQDRLSKIAAFHLERLKWRSRGFTWYAWRTLVSLCLFAVAVYVSRWVGLWTTLLAKGDAPKDADPDASGTDLKPAKRSGWRMRVQQLRGVSALVLYLGGMGTVWVGAIMLAGNFVWDVDLQLESLLGWATYPIGYVGDHPVSIWSLSLVFIWTMIAVWLGRPVQNFMSEQLLEHFNIDRGVRDAAGAFSRYFVIIAGLVGGLASVGIGLGSLAVFLGVLTFGISFGLQNIVANFISGFILLLERPIRKGDFIQVGDMVGHVIQVSARATIVETRDGVSVIVPNSDLITEKVINLTKGQDERIRLHVNVGVAYGSDLKLVEELMLDVARRHRKILMYPKPIFRMLEFGDSALDVVLNAWTTELRGLPLLQSELYRMVDDAFREAGVVIPFPQRDVHMIPQGAPRSEDPPVVPPDSDEPRPDSEPPEPMGGETKPDPATASASSVAPTAEEDPEPSKPQKRKRKR